MDASPKAPTASEDTPQPRNTDSPSRNVLNILKKGPRILYPNLVLTKADSPTAEEPGAPAATDAGSMGWTDFPLLQALRGSLNAIWGHLALKENTPRNSMAFYGCSASVGTTTLAFHTAVFLALSQGVKTVYIDTDTDKGSPDIHPIGATTLRGLHAYCFEEATVAQCLHPTRIPNFFVMPTGVKGTGLNTNQFPSVHKIKQMARELHDRFDMVVFDCPPVLANPIAITYGLHVQHILLVSRYAVTRREVCQQTVETFRDNNLEVAGMVLNQREYPIPMNIYKLLK